MRYRLTIDGMVAVHAKRELFTALAGVPGVIGASVEMGEAEVDCDASVGETELRAAIEGHGYSVRAVSKVLPLR